MGVLGKGTFLGTPSRDPKNIVGIYLPGSLYSIIFLLYSWGSLFGVPCIVPLLGAQASGLLRFRFSPMDSMWVRILGLIFSRGHLNPKTLHALGEGGQVSRIHLGYGVVVLSDRLAGPA